MPRLQAAPAALVLLSTLLCCGCSSDSHDANATSTGGPVYAVSTAVFTPDGERTVYIALTNSLDVSEISFDDARELVGVANSQAIGGKLYISDGESPIITRYEISDDLRWLGGDPVDDRIDFEGFPLADNANFFGQYEVDEHTMYLPFEASKRIVWDPTELKITEVLEDSELEVQRDGFVLEPAGNRTGVRYDGPVMQAFFYRDDDWYRYGATSPIAVYDPETHRETSIIEGPCPGLAVPSIDEAGNTYFSAWDYTPLFALYGAGPAPCVARVTPDRKLDESFTTDMTEWTGGHYVMNFRYVRDGWGFADVLMHEELDADFTGKLDPAVLDQIWDFSHFQLWKIDVERGEAAPYEDVEGGSFGWSTAEVDGRTFLFVPQDGGARTKIYELDEQGNATEFLEVLGDASWEKVR